MYGEDISYLQLGGIVLQTGRLNTLAECYGLGAQGDDYAIVSTLARLQLYLSNVWRNYCSDTGKQRIENSNPRYFGHGVAYQTESTAVLRYSTVPNFCG